MPKFTVSGDLLHAFVIEVEADTQEAAISKVETFDIPKITDYDTSAPGVRVDYAIQLDVDGNEIDD